jgi:Domain of unknown function (DUF4386)
MTTTTLERPRNQTSVGTQQDRLPRASAAAPTYRKTATTVGVIYLMGMVVGIGGNILIQSILGVPDYLAALGSNSMLLAFGAMLWLLPAVGDAAHGMLMFPVLNRYSRRIAVSYLGARVIDAVFVAIMVLFILFQIPVASEYMKTGAANATFLQSLGSVFSQAQLYAYHFGMLTVGCAGLMLNYAFYRARLLPRVLGVWGLVGYTVILCGSVLEIMGLNLNLLHTLPGGVWELFVGVWLIVKGFNASPASLEGTP